MISLCKCVCVACVYFQPSAQPPLIRLYFSRTQPLLLHLYFFFDAASSLAWRSDRLSSTKSRACSYRSSYCMRPKATSVWGLQLLVYEALQYSCASPRVYILIFCTRKRWTDVWDVVLCCDEGQCDTVTSRYSQRQRQRQTFDFMLRCKQENEHATDAERLSFDS